MSDAARILTRTPDEFLAQSRADMDAAKREVAKLKAGGATLASYDAAMRLLGDAAARASVARNAHPVEALRNAAETCEQELDALMTELSLDRGIYDALAAIDLNREDAATRH